MRLGYNFLRGRNDAYSSASFNEAEAHAPRIPNSPVRDCAGDAHSFNEAEAHAPRIQLFIKLDIP